MSNSYRPITDTWILARPKVPFYGAYPAGFLHRARRLLGVTLKEPLLHVCGGRARDYSHPAFGVRKGVPLRGFGPNDRTLDLDPSLEPDFEMDAREPWPCRCFYRGSEQVHAPAPACAWRAALIDRPYTPEDADHYMPGRANLPELGAVLHRAKESLAVGGRVGVLDYLWPRPPVGLECIAAVSVLVGYSNRVRLYSVFERVGAEAGPWDE